MNHSTLNNGSILFFAIIMVALASSFVVSRKYGASNRQVAEQLQSGFFSYEDLYVLHASGKLEDDYLLVDLRSEDAYLEGHLPGAVNIPSLLLAKRSERKALRTRVPILLYADQEHMAVAAQALLLGLGYEQILVIPGNYHTIKAFVFDDFDPSRAFFREDKARWDHQRFMPLGNREEEGMQTVPVLPAAQETTTVIGGC